MPTNEIQFPPQPSGFRLAMTFDVTGNNVVAGGFGSNFCDNVESGFEFGSAVAVAGTVAADGSFTLATPTSFPLETISIKGMVPPASGEPWSGSYAVSLTSAFSPSCDANLAGTFTATYFPLVSGVYTGTASMTRSVNGVPATTTMALQVTLQQGGTSTDARGYTITSNTVLTGSIKVQGSPCFSSGTTTGARASALLGNEVALTFAMDDGSTLTLTGSLTDAGESRIATNLVLITGGQCGGSTLPVAYRLAELDRQM
jgi:hypothetical protein